MKLKGDVKALTKAEAALLRFILAQCYSQSSTSVSELARMMRVTRPELMRLLNKLAAKTYVQIKRTRTHSGYYAIPLRTLNGDVYKQDEVAFVLGEDGVKRFTKPMKCFGYGLRKQYHLMGFFGGRVKH